MTDINQKLDPPPYKIKVVEPIKKTTRKERKRLLEEAGYNFFNIAAENIYIDLLTDSGTSAMSDYQWAGLMLGDESYAQCKNFFNLQSVVQDITGYKFVIPTHQGRSAENLICYALNLDDTKVTVSNQFFDTTRANIEISGAKAYDFVIPEAFQPSLIHNFKGNLNTGALEDYIQNEGDVSLIVVTVTNNAGGGQPVSLANIIEVSRIAKMNKIPFFLDAARFAENAYFIKLREKEYQNNSPKEIASMMFSNSDGCMVSAKKDGLVNIGGFIALNDEQIYRRIKERMTVIEGFPTYGGLAGRDLEAIARGLTEVIREDYLEYRHQQLEYLGKGLEKGGVPFIKPVGGHSINLDVKSFLPNIPQSEFPAWALTIALYEYYGIRAAELGSVAFARKQDDGKWIFPELEQVRLAIPRRVYSQEHLNYVIDSVLDLYKHRADITGMKIVYDPGVLRHFTARFSPLG
ncbi:MAG: tryptophanase [Candidatus Heimdallarchaeota archaeon]|nr:MAG: tryptophanase [Candidatus Heimdallarchaeota archaeon]